MVVWPAIAGATGSVAPFPVGPGRGIDLVQLAVSARPWHSVTSVSVMAPTGETGEAHRGWGQRPRCRARPRGTRGRSAAVDGLGFCGLLRQATATILPDAGSPRKGGARRAIWQMARCWNAAPATDGPTR